MHIRYICNGTCDYYCGSTASDGTCQNYGTCHWYGPCEIIP